MLNKNISVCNNCLNNCKCIRPIVFCHNYYNPNKRQIDYRCKICNKKIPKYQKLCLEHQSWLKLIQNTFGFFGLMSKFRELLNKQFKK